MKETYIPKQNYAKAFGTNMRISTKSAQLICRVIKNKPLTRSKRLLEDLAVGTRSLEGKYYTKTVKAILNLLHSCEKNAEFKNLYIDRLFVHASAHQGTNMRRRRRKGAFGSKLKSTNMEILLIERGKQPKDKMSKKKIKEQLAQKPIDKVGQELEIERKIEGKKIEKELQELKEEQKELQKDVEEAEKGLENKKESGAESKTEKKTESAAE